MSASLHHLSSPPQTPWSPAPWTPATQSHLLTLLLGATKRSPNNAAAHTHLGLLYLRLSCGADALIAFQRARQILDARVRRLGAATAPIPASLAKAVARLRALTAHAAHVAASSRLTRAERAPLIERLQADFVASTNEDVTQPDVWNALALLHLGEGGLGGAKAILEQIVTVFPEYLDAVSNLGVVEAEMENLKEAVGCFQRVLRKDVGHIEALVNYGGVLLRMGAGEGAVRAFRSAVDGGKDRGFGAAWTQAGLALAEGDVGHWGEAERAAVAAVGEHGSGERFRGVLACVRLRSATRLLRKFEAVEDGAAEPRGAIDSAVALLRTVVEDDGGASARLGAALRLRHECQTADSGRQDFGQEAAERLVAAIEEDQADPTAWLQLALLQLGAGEYSSAKDCGVHATKKASDSNAAWNILGVSHHLNDEVAEAVQVYERFIAGAKSHDVVDCGPDLAVAGLPSESICSDTPDEKPSLASSNLLAAMYSNLGNAKRQEKQFGEALVAYEKSLEIGGESPAVFNNIALLHVATERFNDAETMFQRALTLAPAFDACRANLSRLVSLKETASEKQRMEVTPDRDRISAQAS